MPTQYIVDIGNRIVRTTFSGVIKPRDPIENVLRLRADPAFRPSFSELIEFDENSDVQLSATDFAMLVEIDPFLQTSKRAIVVGTRQSVYGTARMFQILMHHDRSVRIFVSEREAESWLQARS